MVVAEVVLLLRCCNMGRSTDMVSDGGWLLESGVYLPSSCVGDLLRMFSCVG